MFNAGRRARLILSNVSVVFGTFNGMKLLGPTLKSLDDQQMGPFRVSICDDASTDESFEVVCSWAKTTRHDVVLSRNDFNKGPSETYKSAVAGTDSDFVVFLGQDDTLEPGHISNLLSLAEGRDDVAAVMATSSVTTRNLRFKQQARRLIIGSPRGGWSTMLSLLGRNIFFAPGALVRRRFWIPGNMHAANMQTQDMELWLYLSLQGQIIQSKQPVLYGIHDNNLHDCNSMDHDLDYGLALRRFLASAELKSVRSHLKRLDQTHLNSMIADRLKVYHLPNPVVFALATMNTEWESPGYEPPQGLYAALQKPLSMPTSLIGWNRLERAQVLAELREWNNRLVAIRYNKTGILSELPSWQIVNARLERALSDRRTNSQFQTLGDPWSL